MPRKPIDPDNLPPHQFPHQLIEAVAENSKDGNFFLLTRGDNGEFTIIPHFTNQPDMLSFLTFINIYSQTMLENSAMMIDEEISNEMFGEEGED